MTTQMPPFWWKGTPEEWNRLPEDARELIRSMSGPVRDKEAERLLAVARGEQYNPEKEKAKSSTDGAGRSKKVEIQYTGIRNWTESVSGIKAERLRNCILYLLDELKDPWYINNCNNRAFVRRFAVKMDAATPEDYHFDPNAVLTSRRKHIDGEDRPTVLTIVQREPENDQERKDLRDRWGVSDSTIKHLAKKDCPKCHGTGFKYVPDYPDEPQYSKLPSSDACDCLWE